MWHVNCKGGALGVRRMSALVDPMSEWLMRGNGRIRE